VDAPPPDFGVLNFNSDEFVPGVRLDAWRSVLSRKLFNVTVDPIPGRAFSTNVLLRILPDVRVGVGHISASINRHERGNAARDNDDILMLVNLDSTFVLEHRKAEVSLDPGDAALIDCAEAGRFVRATDGAVAAIRFRRDLLDGVRDLGSLLGRKIGGGDGRMQMLVAYANALCDPRTKLDVPELRSTVTRHLADLAVLAIGATRDRTALASRRGNGAARLEAIRADVAEFLGNGDLGVHWIAARHGITPRHVHRLFERDNTTFSEYLLGARLTRAHVMLSNPRQRHATIATIAYLCGFNDVPHFNRTFRARFGMTPSEVRALRKGLHD
jgi:AraC-like DNA-binding protein